MGVNPKPRPQPKLGDDCYCDAHGNHETGFTVGGHKMATDCFVDCDFNCRAPKLCITPDDLKRALTHYRDHVYRE